ncbi:MAG: methyl-accepting chemotaxis protein [Bacteriovoracaceae bacterium]|nr:methyl-accepting chemotaxis protein [Bacteriovoracaceae bacterium]
MKSFPLKSRLIFASFICLSVLSLVNWHQFSGFEKKLKKSTTDSFQLHIENLVDAISAQFYERYGDVQAFGLNEVFQSSNKEGMEKTLNSYVTLYGIYDAILFVDTNGKLIASNSVDSKGKKINIDVLKSKNFVNENWFKKSMKGITTDDATKGMVGTLVEDPSMDDITSAMYGDQRASNSFSALVKNSEGTVIGVITNRANLQWIEHEIFNGAQQLISKGHKLGEILVLSENKEIFVKQMLDGSPKKNVVNSLFKKEKNRDSNSENNDFIINSILKGDKFIDSLKWSISLRIPKEDVLGPINNDSFAFKISIFVISVISLLFLIFVNTRVSKFLIDLTSKFALVRSKNSDSENQLRMTSQKLAASGQEQAAAIQETVSALSEMSSMIAQTGQNIKLTQETSLVAQEKTDEGIKVMLRMEHTMKSIQRASDQIQSIATAIEEISAKTNLINDIVFKSQLLSFNASIEAARAGQQGRGFAVVAEEVGNLAEMSGEAALEIESLIKDCQIRVKETIDTIVSRIDDGAQVNQLAQSSFADIASRIKDINQQIQSIQEATQQQEIGIQQSNSAMKQMDLAAQQNSMAATKCFRMTDELKNDSNEFLSLIDSFTYYLTGNISSSSTAEVKKIVNSNNIQKLAPSLQKKQVNDHSVNEDSLESLAREILAKKSSVMSSVSAINDTQSRDEKLTNIDANDESFKKVC